jgi:hypothetical protein
MKSTHAVSRRLILAAFCLSAAAGSPRAAEPVPLGYQGRLTDALGAPRNGSFSVVFGIYETATGGSPLFTDTQTVTVTDGVLNALIGAGASAGAHTLADAVAGGTERYLQVTVDGNALLPRQRLAASPYSLSGGLTLRRLNLTLSGATVNSLAVGNASFVKIASAGSNVTINGIAGGYDGRMIVLYNATGRNVGLADTTTPGGAAASEQIRTDGAPNALGTGVTGVYMLGEGAATLVYDGEVSKWILVSLSKPSGT